MKVHEFKALSELGLTYYIIISVLQKVFEYIHYLFIYGWIGYVHDFLLGMLAGYNVLCGRTTRIQNETMASGCSLVC
jgi:hypothetical protein